MTITQSPSRALDATKSLWMRSDIKDNHQDQNVVHVHTHIYLRLRWHLTEIAYTMRSVVEREFGRWSWLAAGDWRTNSEDADQLRRYSVLLDKSTLSFPQRVPPDTSLLYPAGLS